MRWNWAAACLPAEEKKKKLTYLPGGAYMFQKDIALH